jgi:hypothetical protein
MRATYNSGAIGARLIAYFCLALLSLNGMADEVNSKTIQPPLKGDLLAIIDLLSEQPQYVSLNSRKDPGQLKQLIAKARLSQKQQKLASFWRVKVEGGTDLRVVMYGVNQTDRPVLIASLSRNHASAGGFQTIGGIWLEPNTEAGKLVNIVLRQTSTPARNDRPFMPGPPLARRYAYDEPTSEYTLTSR